MTLITLDRFGYDLTVIDETKEKAIKAMLKEYRRAYAKWNNGARPTKEELEAVDDAMRITELTLGKVEWL